LIENIIRNLTATTLGLVLVGALALPVQAADTVVAKVNGKAITDQDMKLAESEIGSDLQSYPADVRRRYLVEFIIENQIFADAATSEKLASGPAYEQRLAYYTRRALRDQFFDTKIRDGVSEAEAKKVYDQQVATLKPEEELRARHILVETEALAKELSEKLKKGEDFNKLAAENSKDPGSKSKGGDLGYFTHGRMVPQFDEAAFKLKKGEVSPPVQSQFGWHIIKVEDRRPRALPAFEQVKERILASLTNRKAQEVAGELRQKAQIEYIDADLKKSVEEEGKGGGMVAVPK